MEVMASEKKVASTEPITKQPQAASSLESTTSAPMTFGVGSGWAPSMGLWRTFPAGPIPRCPPGLEPLLSVDTLFVLQYIEIMELVSGFEMQNRYMIRDSKGENVFFAAEDSTCCCRLYCGAFRPFNMHFYNVFQQEVILIERPFRCMCCCLLQELDIFVPPDKMVATVEQDGTYCAPIFTIYGRQRRKLLTVTTPFCTMRCDDITFDILDPFGVKIGTIVKKWRGIIQEWFADADAFCIKFPFSMDVTLKACILCIAMLIDFVYFEK